MTHPTCNTCFWFEALKEQCRRFPPEVLPLFGSSGTTIVAAAFSTTKAENWCGEHKPDATA